MFNKYIAAYIVERYYLLILNNYKSYITAEFNYFYKKY